MMLAIESQIKDLNLHLTSSPADQAFGVSLLGFAFIGFRIPEIAGKSLPAFGQVFSIVSFFFVVLISFHLITGQVSGPTATVNLVLNIVFSTLFYLQSKKA